MTDLRAELAAMRARLENTTPATLAMSGSPTYLEDDMARLLEAVEAVLPVLREIQGLPSRYTRAPGANGDRVADLLTEDSYNLATKGLDALTAALTQGGPR